MTSYFNSPQPTPSPIAARGAKPERTLDIAGLQTTAIGAPDARLTLVLLHGYAMRPSDLSPFAHSLGVPAHFLLPRGPVISPLGGHAWWAVDLESREAALNMGPRDLAQDHPSGLPAAHEQLERFLTAVTAQFPSQLVVLGGFSQGGMLALDYVLRSERHIDGLLLLSASRLAINEWEPRRSRLRNLPTLVSHGTRDPDLAFAAGERLHDFVLESGARTSWVPFEGGHEIPLVVWRGLRKFLAALLE
jgi:phospholipase/carboxylesterase